MPSRYYFLSSLPMLRYHEPAPLTWENFLSQALGNISNSDYKLLCLIPEGKDGGNSFLRKWYAVSAKLADAVNAQRKVNLGRDDVGPVVLREYDIERVATAAMNAKNPLEAEFVLMKFGYDYLESAKGLEPFSENALLAYALQLRILLRKDGFSAEKGNEQYKKLFGIIQKEMNME